MVVLDLTGGAAGCWGGGGAAAVVVVVLLLLVVVVVLVVVGVWLVGCWVCCRGGWRMSGLRGAACCGDGGAVCGWVLVRVWGFGCWRRCGGWCVRRSAENPGRFVLVDVDGERGVVGALLGVLAGWGGVSGGWCVGGGRLCRGWCGWLVVGVRWSFLVGCRGGVWMWWRGSLDGLGLVAVRRCWSAWGGTGTGGDVCWWFEFPGCGDALGLYPGEAGMLVVRARVWCWRSAPM